jgi:hypothetical protein
MESQEVPPPRRVNPQMMLIGAAATLFIVLLALTIALGMIFALRDDMASLEAQARRSAKETKALQEEIAALREQAAALAAKHRAEPPRAENIDAANSVGDCVIRPGSKDPMAGCQQLGAQ